MNKLSALYTVMKHVKEMEKVNASAHGEIQFGETVIGKVDAKAICEDGKCTKQVEAQFGEETIKFERSGSDEGACCGHGHHGHHAHAHGHKLGQGHGNMKCHSKLGKAMMMLKLLDKMAYEELASGQKKLSLEMTMADLPEGMRAKIEEHLKTNCCLSESNDCASECSAHAQVLKQLKICGCMDVNPETIMPEKLSIKMLLDESGKPLQADLLVVVNSKLITGEAKDLRVSLAAKLI